MNINPQKSVVITGASSGIGRATVAQMIHAGWRVFATVRRTEDASRLLSEFGDNLSPAVLDVTDRASIDAAAEKITLQLQGRGLDALVNVAGVGAIRPIEYVRPVDLKDIFEINVFGQLAVMQAFLPLLRRARGRIVNIGSVGAHVPIPFGALLNASKAAFTMFSNTLRLEMRPFGIRVSLIEPGAINTPAVTKTLGNVEGVIATLPPAGAAQYGETLTNFARRAHARERAGSPPEVVAHAVHHALTASRPRTRYVVGKHARLLATLPNFLPDPVMDRLLLRMLGLPTKFGAALEPSRRAPRRAVREPKTA